MINNDEFESLIFLRDELLSLNLKIMKISSSWKNFQTGSDDVSMNALSLTMHDLQVSKIPQPLNQNRHLAFRLFHPYLQAGTRPYFCPGCPRHSSP